MPSPVSPDSGVPEHQPEQRRQNNRPQFGSRSRQTPNGPPTDVGRPRTGQFAAGQNQPGQPGRPQPGQQTQPGQPLPDRTGQFQPRQSGQFQSGQSQASQFHPGSRPSSGQARADQPRLDQFSTRTATDQLSPDAIQGPGDPAENGPDGPKGHGKRDWIWSVVAFLVAAGVIAAVGFYFFGPDNAAEPTASWAVEGCAGPSPAAEGAEDAVDAYLPLSCDDPDATVTVLDIQDAVSVAQLHCPAGSDVVFQKDGQAGGETQAVCARNLSDDHPGDPGEGGGQLLAGDCVDGDGNEVACASDGAHKVTGLVLGGYDCPDGTANKLELGFDAQRSYETICLDS